MRLIDADRFLRGIEHDHSPAACWVRDIIEQERTVTLPPSAPLTLEELREMDGEPVWCESEHRPDGAGWFLVDASALQPYEFIAIGRERGIPCAGIDKGYWSAYRRKPEEGMT